MIRRIVLTMIVAIPLTACTGSLLKSKLAAPSAYILAVRSDAAATPAATLPVDLTILKPRLAPGLDSDRIAALYPDRRLEFFAGGHWSGTLDEVLQAFAVQSFLRRGALRSVSGDATRFDHTHWLELNVEDFQAEYRNAGAPPVIKVRIAAQLGNSADHTLLGQYVGASEQLAGADRLGSIVEAYEIAANAALTQIVAATLADVGRPAAQQ
jgi:ABC-type uncharacterized transport system auxiliary subunit